MSLPCGSSDLQQLLTPESIVNNTNNNNDTYCLRWTRHAYMLSDALELNKNEISTNFQEDPMLDLTIHLDDGSVIKLHSVVLAAGSDYFQSLGQWGSGHNTPTIQYSTSNTQYSTILVPLT